MKKNSFILLSVLTLVLLVSGCSKRDTTDITNTTPEGTWSGTGQYGITPGDPTYVFTINFKANGTVDITGNNSVANDAATGTWQMVADSIRAAYRYTSSSAEYALSAKYTPGNTAMTGTIGLSPSITGVGIFSVTKQ